MIDDPLTLLSLGIWLMAAGMYPLGFLFGACSACCEEECPWLINFNRCMRVEVLDVDPPDGWDCRVTSGSAVSGNAGPFVVTPYFNIGQVPTQVSVTIRTRVSVIDPDDLTPVGETRTLVWRFNRPAVTSGVQIDVIGPPWYLEVELSVTGVETQEEEGVTTTFGLDEHGQTKLFLDIRQGRSLNAITHDEQITLELVGLQRWTPISASVTAATLVSGTPYFGWSVLKTAGRQDTQKALALYFPGFVCAAQGTAASLGVPTFVLDDEAATNFLTDESPIVFPGTVASVSRQLELTILPASQLCEVTDMGTGVALGVYPENIYVEVPESYSSTLDIWCGDDVLTMRANGGVAATAGTAGGGICASGWGPLFYSRRGTTLRRGNMFASGIVTPRQFYGYRTLLWAIEKGPYRTSFTSTGPSGGVGEDPVPGDWVYRLEGEGQDPLYEKHFLGGCAPGTSTNQVGFPATPHYDVCTKSDGQVVSRSGLGSGPAVFSVTVEYTATYQTLESVDLEPIPNCGGSRLVSVGRQTQTVSGSVAILLFRGQSQIVNGQPRLRFFGNSASVTLLTPGQQQVFDSFTNECNESYGITLTEPGLGATFSATASAPVECEVEGELSVEAIGSGSFSGVRLVGGLGPGTADNFPESAFLSHEVTVTSATVNGPVPFSSPRRLTCSDWDETEVPKEGITLTRTCQLTDGSAVPTGSIFGITQPEFIPETAIPRSIVVVPSPSLTPRQLFANRVPALGSFGRPLTLFTGTSSILQVKNCELTRLDAKIAAAVGSRTVGFTPGTGDFIDYNFINEFNAGECAFFTPVFRAAPIDTTITPTPVGGLLCPLSYQESQTSCDNCEVQVSDGESEFAEISYVDSGDKQGLIRVVAKKTWLGGQGVTMTVSCGGDEITRTLRRIDTPPLEPRNLTVTRGPCSEALLQWEAPEWNGGQPITAYNIQFRRIGGSYTTFGTVAPPALSATVTGLLRLGYEFRVSATNSVGTSAFSNVAVDGFTLAAPTGLTAAPRDPCDAVSLSWTPPTQSECVVVSEYQVQYRVTNVGSYQTFATVLGTNTTATVTGLTPTTGYQFRIGRVDDANTVLFSNVISVAGCPPE